MFVKQAFYQLIDCHIPHPPCLELSYWELRKPVPELHLFLTSIQNQSISPFTAEIPLLTWEFRVNTSEVGKQEHRQGHERGGEGASHSQGFLFLLELFR